MSGIDLIITKAEKYFQHQQLIDFFSFLIFVFSTILIALSLALFFLKSPFYGIVGIIPIFFYRPISFIERARRIEEKIGLNGELVNSIQLSRIPMGSKEKYSKELINAYINDAAEKIKEFDFKNHLNYKPLSNAVRFLLVVIIFVLIHPALLPEHFWYSLNHKIYYSVAPKNIKILKGTEIDVSLHLYGVLLPNHVELLILNGSEVIKHKIEVQNGIARKSIQPDKTTTYQFRFLDLQSSDFTLTTLEPMFIEALSFRLAYPPHTRLKDESKTGRRLIAPHGTRVYMRGRASQSLESGWFILDDTLALVCDGKNFVGEFVVQTSRTATLQLRSHVELKEQIVIYAIPDLAPLVDIFYPGYNINLPGDMQLDIGIRCSDDYGLAKGTFYYTFEEKNKKPLAIANGVIEDTIYFNWDLSNLGMLPGDEIKYYVEVTDNAGNTTISKTYSVYFPTMEEIYDEISRKEALVEKDLADLQTEHSDELKEIERIQQKIMAERELQWADQEKLKDVIAKEKEILDKIYEWQVELERTIEKLKEGIILDNKSIERMQEIAKILQEIAPDELKKALEKLQQSLNERPQDMQKSLEDLKKNQEELAKALERTLNLLRRYQQEEKLKELAQLAKELAGKADEMDKLMKESKNMKLDKETAELNKGIDKLTEGLKELAESESLEDEIKEALEKLTQQSDSISKQSSASLEEKKQGLDIMAADLERLYESLTKGRTANLRKNLLAILNQLIDISQSEEEFCQGDVRPDIDQQNQIINATKIVAESLYAQQTKSLYVTPRMGKNLAKAIAHMEKTTQVNQSKQNAREAMKLINLVCLDMLRNLEKVTKGGSSTGMDKFLEQLSDISKGQMSLNQSLSGLFPIPISGLTAEQQLQLRRLAGKQRALRESLESLRNEAGVDNYQELLNNIINEMEKTEEALYQYKLDRELIERQKKILSRLLDAQKSIRKEDYGKKRKSKPGKDFLTLESPKALSGDLGKDELRELIQKALRETYPKEYELYIREYFRSLLEKR